MDDLAPQDMANKLVAEGFTRAGRVAQALSDPIADTPMVVTLDDLRPYELDPRITRNPRFDDIKASIRKRGLDAPPPITRRPGAGHYSIRNGGNTRLAILRELWSETKEEQFFRIPCLFRPWPERGDIIALTGHLAENELRGGLTFIERALGVEKARELYEQESGKSLSQSELARRLTTDGYPVQQSHISRMQETVRYLLPAIPTLLYAGLGRHQVERLAVLRRAAEFTWAKWTQEKPLTIDFETLFHDVLALFDTQLDTFSVRRVQDELIGQMAGLLGADYNTLELDIDQIEQRHRAVAAPPQTAVDTPTTTAVPDTADGHAAPPLFPRYRDSLAYPITKNSAENITRHTPTPPGEPQILTGSTADATPSPDQDGDRNERVQGHIVSPATSTERLQAIQQWVAEHTGEGIPDFADNALRAIPVQAGGLFPITDVWYIEPGLDSPDRLRSHIAQFAREIAGEAGLAECITVTDTGIGFVVATTPATQPASLFGRTLLALLHALGSCHDINLPRPDSLENFLLDDGIGVLLLGNATQQPTTHLRLTDTALVKLFRLLRLARRLLESGTVTHDEPGH